ncbi:MAG: hypothetical protein AAF829_00945 [Pseudomonadota bacterium]
MMHPSTKKLLDRLAEMTRNRRIAWQETSTGGGVAYAAEGYTVHLIKEPQTMQLTDANGTILENVSSDELAQTESESGSTYIPIFDETYREAARQARGTERAIDAVMAGLDLDGDGIPDIAAPVPAQENLQPSVPSEDASAYEDVADESGFVDNAGPFGASETGMPAVDASTTAFSTTAPTEPEPTIEDSIAPQAFTQTDPLNQDAFQSATPVHAGETDTLEASEDSASNVGEAVANMANEVNSGDSFVEQPSTSRLSSGGFGATGFAGGFGSQFEPSTSPVEPSAPEPIMTVEDPSYSEPEPAAEDVSAWGSERETVDPSPAPTSPPFESTPEQVVAETPEPSPPVYDYAETKPVGASADLNASTSDRFSSCGAPAEPSLSIDTLPESPALNPETTSSFDSPADTARATSYEATVPSPPAEDTAFQETVTPIAEPDPGRGPESDPVAVAPSSWSPPAAPSVAQIAPAISAPPDSPEPVQTPQTLRTGLEPAQQSNAGQADRPGQPAGTVEGDKTSVSLPPERRTWGAVEDTVQGVGEAVSDTAQTAASEISGAAASLAGTADTAVQSTVDAGNAVVEEANTSARSILGGAASQASGAAASLAGSATAAVGSAGQALDGVANKLNPLGGSTPEPAVDGEDDVHGKPKPLTRFNPWS